MKNTTGLILISASALAFEVTLTRIFAIQQFHHFAFLVIGLAVMGFAASGVIIAYKPYGTSLIALCLAYSAAILLAYTVINFVPFDSYSIAWDRQQIWILFLYFLSAAIPFLIAGWVIGANLTSAGPQAYRPYAANLAGSALGVPLALVAIPWLGGEGTVMLSTALGVLAAAAFSVGSRSRWALLGSGLMLGALSVAVPSEFTLQLSPYKPLSLTELAPEARTTISRWAPSARIDVVESGGTHVFPGLSLNADLELPQQAALFVDGDGPLPITDLSSEAPEAATLARHMPAALAYQLRPGAESLLMQPGAGLEALVALAAGANRVSVAQDEPVIFEILDGPYGNFSQGLFQDTRLDLLERPSRGALLEGGGEYDIVHFALSEPFRPVTNGAFSLTEHYPLTVESLSDAMSRQSENGLVVLTRWLGTPPSESARAWATLLAAMDPVEIEERVVAYRGMRTATMIASARAYTSEELQMVREFLELNGYDPIWLPDLRPEEVNQRNRLPEPVYHELYSELIKFPQSTIDSYDFNLQPPTDDRPYFYHFFRWAQTPEVLSSLGQTWQPFGGSGYLVLVVLLGMMVLLAAALLILPGFAGASPSPPGIAYFACIGAGYLLVEIPLIQQFTLLLDRPTLALATVLFTLLLTSGVGSWFSIRLPLRSSIAVLVALVIVIALALPFLTRLGLPWPLGARLLLVALVLAPLGTLMGIPFASGLRRIRQAQIPWAWSVNGALSGVGGVVAAMLALDLGFRAALVIGAAAYLGALLVATRRLALDHQPV
ncbi:MAG: hypothetical protein ACE5JF_07060 [Anaerolineales bacterium]